MKNARPTEVKASALDQRGNYTSPAPRPDIAQAVKDIRLACDTIARLAALDTLSEKGVKQ